MIYKRGYEIKFTSLPNKAEVCKHAVQSFGFILPYFKETSWQSFCDAILSYCDHPKAKALVQELLT